MILFFSILSPKEYDFPQRTKPIFVMGFFLDQFLSKGIKKPFKRKAFIYMAIQKIVRAASDKAKQLSYK